MAGQPLQKPSGESAGQPWRSSLDALEAALAQAARAITDLRFSLESESSAPSGPVGVPDAPAANEKSERVWQRLERASAVPSGPVGVPDAPAANEKSERVWQRLERASAAPGGPVAAQHDPATNEKSEHLTDFERVWQRLERQRGEPTAAGSEQDDLSKPGGPGEPSEPRNLDLLPKEYLMTIENRDASVDLITLQRGLLTLVPMENIRLLTYAKGVPVISLRVEGELDLERLSEAVGSATGRRCEVIPQDGTKLFLRLTPDDDHEEAAA